MVGTAFDESLARAVMSLNQLLKAIDMVNQFSHSMLAPPPRPWGRAPGYYGTARALMRRIAGQQPTAINVFHRGFQSCDRYMRGTWAIECVTPCCLCWGRRPDPTESRPGAGGPPDSTTSAHGESRASADVGGTGRGVALGLAFLK
jgi:hypothetical protein